MKTVLAPIDFSAQSARVIDQAIALARGINGRLIILHVVQPPPITDADIGGRMSADYTALAVESAEQALGKLQRKLLSRAITVETMYRVGLPGRMIVEQAEKLGANYLVLGSHGHGAFHDLIMGSTTTRVLKQARCPVVIVSAVNAAKKTPRKKK